MAVRARPVIVPRPTFQGEPRDRLFGYAVDVLFDPGDDPMPTLRMLSHFQIIGGGEVVMPAFDGEDERFYWR